MARKPADQTVNAQDIIRAAAEVLYRNGYEATTMKDIAASVNLTAASLYHHFRNKDELLLAVLEDGLNRTIALIDPIAKSDKPNVEKLAEMIRVHVTNVTEHTVVGAAMVFEIRALMNPRITAIKQSEELLAFAGRRDAFFARRDTFEGLFRQVVQAGIESGEFRPVDVGIFVKTVLGAQNWVGVWYREGGRLDGATIAGMMVDIFLSALKR